MQAKRLAFRLWNSPVAVIVLMGVCAVLAVHTELRSGTHSFALMGQTIHTGFDVVIFMVFEKAYTPKRDGNEGEVGIYIAFVSYAAILSVMLFTDQDVGTSSMLFVLSLAMFLLKLRYVFIAHNRDKNHEDSSTLGAISHFVGDLCINVVAVISTFLAFISHKTGYFEGSLDTIDIRLTVLGVGLAIGAGIVGLFAIRLVKSERKE